MTEQVNLLAITIGDPSGIGPEIIVKALVEQPGIRALVFGCPSVMERAVGFVGADCDVLSLRSVQDARFTSRVVEVVRSGNLNELPAIGQIQGTSGQAALCAIQQAVACALEGEVSVIVTAEIHEEALSQAGITYPGHTEMLADFGGAERGNAAWE